jgi:hypothetical protein
VAAVLICVVQPVNVVADQTGWVASEAQVPISRKSPGCTPVSAPAVWLGTDWAATIEELT